MGTLLAIVIFLPIVGAAAVMAAGDRRPGLVRAISLLTTIVVFALCVLLVTNFEPGAGQSEGPVRPQMTLRTTWISLQPAVDAKLEFFIGLDGISVWLVALTASMMIPAILISWQAISDRVAQYYALLLFLETSMLGVFCSFDVILFYVFFEFTLIPLYFLIGQWGGPRKRYAAGKFFVYTLTGSLLGLLGLVALLVTLSGADGKPMSFSIPDLAQRMKTQVDQAEGKAVASLGAPAITEAQAKELREFWRNAQWWIFLALFAGFAIKVPLVPLHTWLPIVHVEAPTAGSVQLACVLLKLGTFGFLRLCLPLVPYGVLNPGVPLVAALASIGIVYGALCALAQSDIKRLVAYSSVSHLGFCMLGMFALNDEGMTGSIVQSLNHGLSTGGLFLLIGMLYDRYHSRDLREIGGMANKLPVLAFFMVFICLSSAGLPGLNGFIGEMLTIFGMYRFHWGYAVVGALSVVLGAWYLFTMMQGALFGPLKEPPGAHGEIRDMNAREWWTIAPIALACLWIGLYPKPILDSTRPEVEAILSVYKEIKPATVGLNETSVASAKAER